MLKKLKKILEWKWGREYVYISGMSGKSFSNSLYSDYDNVLDSYKKEIVRDIEKKGYKIEPNQKVTIRINVPVKK